MTAKAKAFNLYFKFIRDVIADNEKAKQCALIAVDEILNLDLHDVGDYKNFEGIPSEWYISYWNEVKKEIQKL